jgi:hypothetical protein
MVSALFSGRDLAQGLVLFCVILVGATLGWFGYVAYGIRAEIRRRFPRLDTVGCCTTCLTPEGIRDTSPEGENLHSWSSVWSIREHQGDIYCRHRTGGLFIPREAWENIHETVAFYQAARLLWESNGKLWPE